MTTNYERIKNMTVEEMTEFITSIVYCGSCPMFVNCSDTITFEDKCINILKQWLQSESKEKPLEKTRGN